MHKLLQLHTKRRNRLAQGRLNDLVFVKYNRALRRRYEMRDTIDPIYLNNIDDSNEWLTGRLDDENDIDDELVFTEEDGLTWNVVATAAGVGEPSYRTRQSVTVRGGSSSRAPRSSPRAPRSSLRLVDEEDSEEEECEVEDEGERLQQDEAQFDRTIEKDYDLGFDEL